MILAMVLSILKTVLYFHTTTIELLTLICNPLQDILSNDDFRNEILFMFSKMIINQKSFLQNQTLQVKAVYDMLGRIVLQKINKRFAVVLSQI